MTAPVWDAMRLAAEATERVTQRQIDLLRLQRQVIDDQLEELTRRNNEATRDVLFAERMIREIKG